MFLHLFDFEAKKNHSHIQITCIEPYVEADSRTKLFRFHRFTDLVKEKNI